MTNFAAPTLDDIISRFESHYPREWAESWDSVGLVLGDRKQLIRRVLLAVDPTEAVVAEAISGNHDLLITHHPLYLRGTSFLSRDDAKGRMVADLIGADIALYCAHTNADVAPGGVADALAQLVGITSSEPLVPGLNPQMGIGRIGAVPTQTVREFASSVALALPAGPTGLFVGGDLEAPVNLVAVSGGSGDSYLEAARAAEADVFLTADLRHHPASEHLYDGGPALLCGSHWATEWPWLPKLARQLGNWFPPNETTMAVDVSTLVTEPWSAHFQTQGSPLKGPTK